MCGSAEAKVVLDSDTMILTCDRESSFSNVRDYSYVVQKSDSSSTTASETLEFRCNTCNYTTPYTIYYNCPSGYVIPKYSENKKVNGPILFHIGTNVLTPDGNYGYWHNKIGTWHQPACRKYYSGISIITLRDIQPISSKNYRHSSTCTAKTTLVTWTPSETDYQRSLSAKVIRDYNYFDYSPADNTYNYTDYSNYPKVTQLVLKDCTASANFPGFNFDVTVNGGRYSGYPAFSSLNTVIVKGTITDFDSTSIFTIGSDSEATVVKDGTTTITTVKLSNPPIIIDWADFPG